MGAVIWFSILVLLAVPQGNNAVHYSITNQAGGAFSRFDKEIKTDYTFQVLKNSTDFIWTSFHQKNNADCRKNVSSVSLFLENMTDIAYSVHNKIYVGSVYLQNYTGDLKLEFTGILFHEMTHVWQWFGNSSTPGGLIEGIADYVRLKAGYVPSHWVKPGQGNRWDQGYDVTARFLDYCNCLKHGVVAELNNKMRIGYSDFYFVQLLGKTPGQLFQDYKALYKYNQV